MIVATIVVAAAVVAAVLVLGRIVLAALAEVDQQLHDLDEDDLDDLVPLH
jgi:hypothetical protein